MRAKDVKVGDEYAYSRSPRMQYGVLRVRILREEEREIMKWQGWGDRVVRARGWVCEVAPANELLRSALGLRDEVPVNECFYEVREARNFHAPWCEYEAKALGREHEKVRARDLTAERRKVVDSLRARLEVELATGLTINSIAVDEDAFLDGSCVVPIAVLERAVRALEARPLHPVRCQHCGAAYRDAAISGSTGVCAACLASKYGVHTSD